MLHRGPLDPQSPWLERAVDRQHSTSPPIPGTSPTRPFERDRQYSARCLALDTSTSTIFIGYSNTAGGIVQGKKLDQRIMDSAQALRRYGRVESLISEVNLNRVSIRKAMRLSRIPANCAEVSALSIAISHGANVANLIFVTVHSDGHIMLPCGNCEIWIDPASGKIKPYYLNILLQPPQQHPPQQAPAALPGRRPLKIIRKQTP